MLPLGRFSLGVGDRFAHQAPAQLQACAKAISLGVIVVPVWNKSNREHNVIGSNPESVRLAAEEAVGRLGWKHPYYVDADHINLTSVDRYIDTSDFFTLDVAAAIGRWSDGVEEFLARHPDLVGRFEIPGINQPISTTREALLEIARKYLHAAEEAGRIYRHVAQARGDRPFITEVSMDETDSPQTPLELLVILAALADEGVPLQTIAPKFTGRFNKGVDYSGDTSQFETEFRQDLAVIAHAIRQYNLPAALKLSIHSGSDKFSIYEPIRRVLRDTGAGVHLKTAGTTWLEELIGLAEAGGEALQLAKEVYAEAYADHEALCEPYAAVIDICVERLPPPPDVQAWTSGQFVASLRHDPSNPSFNSDLRQLLHVGYKIAAAMGERYRKMIEDCAISISRNVTHNLFERHICPLFLNNHRC
jgi:hypothetical protein